jgi:hypothetical protein
MIYELAQIVKSVERKSCCSYWHLLHVLFSSSQPLWGICDFVEESGSLHDSWQCCCNSLFFHGPRIWQTIRATVFADQVLCQSTNLGVHGFQRPNSTSWGMWCDFSRHLWCLRNSHDLTSTTWCDKKHENTVAKQWLFLMVKFCCFLSFFFQKQFFFSL